MQHDIDVLICGAGPTGLMLANQLVRQGTRVMLIDRHAGPAQQTRAMAVQARTLEIYDRLGIAPRALELGLRGEAANLWANGRRKARIPLGDIGKGMSPYPFVLMLGQDDNERILGDRLRDFGVAPRWKTELLDFEQSDAGVLADVKQPDGTVRRVSAAWLAGCDGAHSRVRERCGITFPGAPYEHVFFVADTVATGPMVPGELNVYLWKDGFHLFFPMKRRDGWRVIGILPANLRASESVTFDDVIPHVRNAAGDALAFQRCHWFSTYRIHHRSASRFRAGRCFLLGDAAHIHSPMGAQGMNTGLQDAYNLAWKLALVVKGRAGAALLDTYEAERLPVAQRLLATTDRAFRLVVSDTWIAGLFRTQIMARMAAFAMRRERARQVAFRTISQIGIRYPQSPLSRALGALPDGAPRPGDRFPWIPGVVESLDDRRFALIVAHEMAENRLAHELGPDIQVLTHDLPWPGSYLLRPDGHVALAGTHLDAMAIRNYFSEVGLTWGAAQASLTEAAAAAPSGVDARGRRVR
jgi:2-polyprenyl-6-methoxyphenol hydroxylase-like FAD-dependent oxidoreductase